ncbi:MAG: acetyl-CoA carboxylase carboxyltransferase subunit beta [Verrucomicrobia bacterium]|nr:acetyl-CoA carboxylase carboxyltransferase subunit beta [Verrucomicrobiota bacterium]MCH8512810.1 acetyl-CoA carboxylase, carboxyltransferase subunit beta [Kiritimatiellia bacterium]
MSSFFSRRLGFTRTRKKDIPKGVFTKCPSCGEMLSQADLEKNLFVCRACGYHFPMDRVSRVEMLTDPDTFEEWDGGMMSKDPLKFTGTDSYEAKLKSNQEKTGFKDAVSTGHAKLEGRAIGLGVMDFSFLAASMGSVVGEKITRLIEKSTERDLPVVLVCTSGGARMYEGMFSLMQMAKTSGALARHAQAGLPYIPILTHPTTAGVMASFATLGDVILAEPQALIGFAGPRVIKETTLQDLPEGFQRSEFLKDKGLIDRVVPRGELRKTVANLLDVYMDAREV